MAASNPASTLPARGHALWRRALAMTRPRTPETLPVRFDRRRIYVLPTRFGLFYSVLLATMALGALNYNNNPALMLALMLAGTGFASLVAAQMQLSGMEVVAIDAEPVPMGQVMNVRVHVQAPAGRTRVGLGVDHEGAPLRQLDLTDQRGEVDLPLATARRGWLDLPRLRIATTRPLGLARAWAHVWPDAPALVYAVPERDGPPLPEGRGEGARARPVPAGEDIHQLRAYRRGDARRAIAWKASARRDALVVRDYEKPLGAEVVLDWHGTALPSREARISRLAHWVDLAEREGRRYRLVLPGQPALGPDRGAHHRHACQRALALMPHG
ncbi:DUF58 domain-containing protein [Marilutibacter penaei]